MGHGDIAAQALRQPLDDRAESNAGGVGADDRVRLTVGRDLGHLVRKCAAHQGTVLDQRPLDQRPLLLDRPPGARLFLRLGFTAYGGPAAHVAMMRDEVV